MERIKEEEMKELFEQPKHPDISDKVKRLKQLELKKKHSQEEFNELVTLRKELNNGKRLSPIPGSPGPDKPDIKVDHTNWGKSISQAQSQDIINTPEHYHLGGIDAITILESKFGPIMSKGFFLGNVIKYVLRYQHKGGIEDLEKARFYLDALIKNEKGQAYEQKTKGDQGDE